MICPAVSILVIATRESRQLMNRLPLSTRSAGRFLCRPVRIAAILAIVVLAATASESEAQAQCFGFQPYGFYQPYGIQYRSSVPTPPYFSVSPPVYYGTRHYRPYGVSPFSAPPQVSAGNSYQSQPAASGMRQRSYGGPVGNPFICVSNSPSTQSKNTNESGSVNTANELVSTNKSFVPGQVQSNPFVDTEVHFASRETAKSANR